MYEHALEGRPYVKSHHNRKLREIIGRSKGSVELKHRNISAALADLGLPWLPGYVPAKNYQKNVLPDVIARHINFLERLHELPIPLSNDLITTGINDLFEEAPAVLTPSIRDDMHRLIRKFDPASRDEMKRELGAAGEEFALEVECRRLHAAGRMDLEKRVRHVSKIDGDGAGYDLLSFDHETGNEALIEVKTTRGAKTTPFFMSRNEEEVSRERPDAYRIYRVFDFGKKPRIFELRPPLNEAVNLRVENWSASFR